MGTRSRVATLLAASALAISGGSAAVEADTATGFEDVADDSLLAAPITWLKLSGVTRGCNPPVNTSFCPRAEVTRGQMAALLARALLLPEATNNPFVDSDPVFADDIARLASAGITKGCNPPHNDRFCPNDPVTREQMAGFLVRAYQLPAAPTENRFTDTGGSVFTDDIARLAAAGITIGCNPPHNDRFCPNDSVTREQIAAFLWRANNSPTPDEPNRLVAVGDISRCELSSDEATADLTTDLFATATGVVAVLGDAVYNDGSPTEFAECYDPGWGRHKFRTLPVPGNHEYRTPDAEGYYDYFGEAAGEPDQGWYSYELAGWQVIALNSNCGEIGGCDAGSTQEQWLRTELASSKAQCTIAYMHHPRFSSGSHGDDDRTEDLWQALSDHDVEMVLAGHDHNYERLGPLTATGDLDADAGVRSFVVGTGGTWLRPADGRRLGSEVLIDDHHGVLVLDLRAGSYEWRFVNTSGQVLDQGTGSCQ